MASSSKASSSKASSSMAPPTKDPFSMAIEEEEEQPGYESPDTTIGKGKDKIANNNSLSTSPEPAADSDSISTSPDSASNNDSIIIFPDHTLTAAQSKQARRHKRVRQQATTQEISQDNDTRNANTKDQTIAEHPSALAISINPTNGTIIKQTVAGQPAASVIPIVLVTAANVGAAVLTNRVPPIKYHPELDCWSSPTMTQEQYENRTRLPLQSTDEPIDILCTCTDTEFGSIETITINRSDLMLSSTLARFFNSPDYLHGCGMRLDFKKDPAVCFEVVQRYLKEGPYHYTSTRLRLQILEYGLVGDRLMVYVKLHFLAKKLALNGLMEMAYKVLRETDVFMMPFDCIIVAEHIFDVNERYDRILKDWCLRHVTRNLFELHDIQEWNELLPRLDEEIGREWIRMVDANADTLITQRNERLSQEKKRAKKQEGEQEKKRLHRENQHLSRFQEQLDQNNGPLQIIDELPEPDETVFASASEQTRSNGVYTMVRKEKRPQGQPQGWEDNFQMYPEIKQFDDSKARRVLGISDPRERDSWKGGAIALETAAAKARKNAEADAAEKMATKKKKVLSYGRKFLNFKDLALGS